MLRLVREAEQYDDEVRARRRAAYTQSRQQEPAAEDLARQGPAVIVRVMRSLWLGVGFAIVAAIAYIAGAAGVLDPLLQQTTAALVAPAPAPVPPAATQAAATQAAVAPGQPQLPMPDVQGLVLLIRNSIVALHQANVTGNYAVLRALAAPTFQDRNSADALAQAFAGLRGANLDLSQVVAVNPRLYTDPVIDADGFLRLAGFVPLGEAKANFELAFQMVDGRWRLFGLGVHPPADAAAKPVLTKAAAAKAAKTVPDDATLLALIRGSVVALNQANISGDYSVLRGIASGGFQTTNSPAKLSEAFSAIRARGLDLAPVAVIDPRLFRPAAIDGNGYLRVAGYFPSQPEQVNFDLVFQFESGAWRLFGIGVDTSRAAPPAVAASP